MQGAARTLFADGLSFTSFNSTFVQFNMAFTGHRKCDLHPFGFISLLHLVKCSFKPSKNCQVKLERGLDEPSVQHIQADQSKLCVMRQNNMCAGWQMWQEAVGMMKKSRLDCEFRVT